MALDRKTTYQGVLGLRTDGILRRLRLRSDYIDLSRHKE